MSQGLKENNKNRAKKPKLLQSLSLVSEFLSSQNKGIYDSRVSYATHINRKRKHFSYSR